MGRYTVIVLSVIIALAVELVSCCSSGGGSRYNPGRPFGLMDVSDNVLVFPNYDPRRDVVGLSVEVRPNSNLDIRLTGGVGASELVNGQIRRPQGELEIVARPNNNVQLIIKAGVDANGNPRGQLGGGIQFRRRRSTGSALLDKETSRMLFKVFDLDQDGKIDVVDWSTEGGKLVSFSDLIVAHDMDGDEKLSLAEFLEIPIMSDLGLGRALGWDDDVKGDDGTPTASPAQD